LELSDYLRGLREAKGLSVRQLADQLGLEPSYISKIEHGDRKPSEPILKYFATYFGVNHHLLMAMSGQLTQGFMDVMLRYPEAFATLLERLPEAPEKVILQTAKTVRDGDW
jgi:HTH-type transcriptional regulator, competence development regulator